MRIRARSGRFDCPSTRRRSGGHCGGIEALPSSPSRCRACCLRHSSSGSCAGRSHLSPSSPKPVSRTVGPNVTAFSEGHSPCERQPTRPVVVRSDSSRGTRMYACFRVEWLSARAHRRSLRYRTAGFTCDETRHHWECPEGQHLWPREFDRERRLVRYRAKAHICNGGGLHRLGPRPRDRRVPGSLAGFRSRPLPPRHLPAHGRPRRTDPRRRRGPPP